MFVAFAAAAPAAHASVSDPFQTFTSQSAFEAAAGGSDNGTTAGQQGTGFRDMRPSAIAANGSDSGTTPIPGGHTAALAPGRLEPWGIELGSDVAVANDGFASVNSHAGFSPPDLWAPFNSNTASFGIVAPAAPSSTPAPAVTRGLGVTFVHVENAGTSIQYFSGDTLLHTVAVTPGATSFAGVLFRDPVVTRVVITLGTAEIFSFDGTTASPGGSDPTTLAAGNDVVVAEPGAGEPSLTATAGIPVSATLLSFDSSDSQSQLSASVDWGDGARSAGTVSPGSGGSFAVSGSHSYAQPGAYTATVTVREFGGSELISQAVVQVRPRSTLTTVTCSPSSVAVSASALCIATVADVDAGSATAPTGVVAFTSPTPAVAFAQDGGCLLGPTASPGVSTCSVQFTPGQLPPAQARLTGAYGGDAAHAASSGATVLGVHAQRCTLQVLSRRLRAAGLGVLVTCDARSGVKVAATALVGGRGRLRPFQLGFGTLQRTVTAGRPTVLIVRPAHGVLPVLRAALRRRQRVSLKLTLVASSRATQRTTTVRLPAIRLR